MENNLCPQCKGQINNPDAEVCPICNCRLELNHYVFSHEEIKQRLKTESPEIVIELDKCPMCGSVRCNKEDICSHCGFTYVPVGFRYKKYFFADHGEDYINSLLNKQKRKLYENDITWITFVVPIATEIILTILLYNLSLSFTAAFAIALVPSIVLCVFFYKKYNVPFNTAMNDIKSRQNEYNKIQTTWIELNSQKENSIYGEPDRIILVDRYQYGGGKKIAFYFDKGFVKYDDEFIDIKEVLECSLDDEGSGKVTTIGKVKNNTLNVVGRSAVGAVVGGAAGAIIGGLTANRSSEYIETVRHDYVINIFRNNPKKSLLRLDFGENISNAREVYALMQVMLN